MDNNKVVKLVTITWVCTDGKQFDSEDEAAGHQAAVTASDSIEEFLSSTGRSHKWAQMLRDFEAFRVTRKAPAVRERGEEGEENEDSPAGTDLPPGAEHPPGGPVQ